MFNNIGLDYNPINTITPDIYNILPEDDFSLKKCVYCGERYSEFENLGQLDCCIHPGTSIYQYKTNSYIYSCCQTNSPMGCMKSDHMDVLLSKKATERTLALKDMSFMIIPQVLMKYGYKRPRSENILMWLDAEPSQIIEIRRRWPYDNKLISINNKEAIGFIRQMADTQPYLNELLRQSSHTKEVKDNKFNDRWQDELSKTVQNKTNKTQFIPLLVIRRLDI